MLQPDLDTIRAMVLFSRDEAFNAHIARAFPALEVVDEIQAFDRKVSEARVDTVLIDCDDHADGLRALKLVRASKASAASACIAVVNGETAPGDAHDLGAWLVVQKTDLWKSIEPLQAWLQAVRRREHFRFPVSDMALIDSGETIGRRVTLVNISLGGASFITDGPADLEHHIVLRLAAGRFACDIVWREPSGRVGVRFTGSRFTAADLRRVVGAEVF